MSGSRDHTSLRVGNAFPQLTRAPTARPLLAALAAVALAIAACAHPEGLWRDQYAFVGDDGTVMMLALHRQSAGFAEVKGWFGRDGRWGANAYHRFDIAPRDAADPSAALASWAETPGAPARAAIARDGGRVAIDLRLPSREVRLRAASLVELGRFTDPEGTSIYRAGRAQMSDGDTAWKGWLVVEETPRKRPRKPFVDYGDFAFAVLASADRAPLVLKRSRRTPGYDQAFAGGAPPRRTARVTLETEADQLLVGLPEWNLDARLSILDRDQARGTTPDGTAVTYETLLLGGDYAGIAFVVRPERRTP